MAKEQPPRRSYSKARPTASGLVHGSRPADALDHGYVSCSVPFYPGARYSGLVSHESHDSKKYYLSRHPTNPAVFTQYDQRGPLTRGLDPEPDVQGYIGIRAVSNAIYRFCIATHNHDVTSAQRQASLTEPPLPVDQLLDWTPTAPGGRAERKKRVRTPQDPSPVRSPSPQTYVQLMDRIWFQRDKTLGYVYKEPVPYAYGFPQPPSGYPGAPPQPRRPDAGPIAGVVPESTQQCAAPASKKQVIVEVPTHVNVRKAVPAAVSPPAPIVIEQSSVRHVKVAHHVHRQESWYVLSDGCVFRDATQAEAAILRTPGATWLHVDSLASAGDWLLTEGLAKIMFMTSDGWGSLSPFAAKQYMDEHPKARLRIVSSLVEGESWVKSLGGPSASSSSSDSSSL
ncbi:hypothetical protein B0H16DRAFT_1712865 [Mycena metata]|uniref:Uncharacterized protein n=1 Tax=Mycena metata TaxID=1033252 RepID=A0AAD7JZV9_9AGAR|nr:hypothetical protein B0H16DRAFT_1712865 [Mycena metata]